MKQIFSVFLSVVGINAAAQTFKPVLKITGGEKFTVTNVTKGSVAQEVMGQKMEIPMDITTVNILAVKKADGGTCDLQNSISRMVLSMSMMGQDVNYDSDKPEDRNSDVGKELNAMLNNPTDFTVNSFGKIIEGSIKKQSPEKSEPGASILTGMLNMGDETEPSQAVNLFNTDAALNIGDSFVVKNTSADGKTKKTATYTLTEVKDAVAKFSITGTDNIISEMETQGMQMVANNTTKITGEMHVNEATGMLIKKILNQVVSGTIEVAGMSIPISGTTTIIISVTQAAK